MALANKNSTAQATPKSYVYLRDLQVGKEAEVRIMICHTPDTHTSYGKYVSTDFIATDEKVALSFGNYVRDNKRRLKPYIDPELAVL